VSFSLPKLDLTSTGSPHNTSVAVELVQGETTTDLGNFDVTDGAATPAFTLPDGVSGDASIRITAAPTGTTADLPITIEAPDGAEATVDAITLPFIEEGSYAYVGVRVTGPDGRPTGTVTVSEGDTKLGSATLYRGYTLVAADTRQLERGKHTLAVDYSGDDTYEPASDEVSTRVKRSN
jgi:5'-nucleotidase